MREVQTGPKIIVENVLPLLGHWQMVSVLVFSDKDGKPYRTGLQGSLKNPRTSRKDLGT